VLEILLIDDETSIRLPVGDALRARGHRVATASDGDEAMARLDSEVFHLVVSDVRLPKGDGFSILRRVRRDCPWTDVLLMTAYGTIADAVAAMKEQAIDYVTKPFDVQELVTVVDRIDERRRLREELREVRAQLAARRSEDLLIGRSPPMARLREQIDAWPPATPRAPDRRERHRQGAGGPHAPRPQPAPRAPLRGVNCAGRAARPHRGRAVRLRAGRLHRGPAQARGALRRRRRGHPVPRRDRGDAARGPGQAAAGLQDGTFEPIGTNTTVRSTCA
jgi:CheY-like chemotaxis protein